MTHDRKLVSRGTVLVDPRAAVAKLRSYQLGEPVMYVLELVRAAVAGGATAIELENDADDFALTFDGDPIDAEDLSRLLDFLLSESHRRLRLIAIAVNTALGFSPRYVDLYTTRFEGAPADGSLVARVRWSPRANAGDGADLGVISRVPRPGDFPAVGMRVHVREAFGLAVLREWFRAAPAETDLLRERVVSLPVPITRNGVALAARDARPPLVTVPLELSGDLRGSLELLEVGHARSGSIVFCEGGVALETVPLRAPRPSMAAPPLRMIVDADALPTNASRSKVTLSAGLRGATRRAWERALSPLLDAAFARLSNRDEDHTSLSESLAALVRFEGGDQWPSWTPADNDDELSGPLSVTAFARLINAPLVPVATGAATSLRELSQSTPRYLWTSSKPPPPELAPWMRGVVWIRGERPMLTALLAPLQMESAAAALSRAREAQSRHQRFMSLPPGDAATQVPEAVLRVRFGARPDVCGEVAVTAKGLLRHGEMRAVPWIERRPLGAVTIERAEVSCEAAFEGPGLFARPDFDGVVRGPAFDEAVSRARDALVEGLIALVEHWSGTLAHDDPRALWIDPLADEVDPLVRARVVRATWTETIARVESAKRRAAAQAVIERHPKLADAIAWTTTDESHALTTDEVIALASKPPHALLTAPPSWTGAHPGGLPVLTLDAEDRATLVSLLPAQTQWVEYKTFLSPIARRPLLELLPEAARATPLPWVTREARGARIAIAPAAQSGRGALTLLHAGRVLESRAHATSLGPALVALEDDALVPSPRGAGALAGTMSPEATQLLEEAGATLARALVSALRGERGAPAIPDEERARVAVLRFLLYALKNMEGAAEHQALGDAITSAPLIPVFGEGDRVRAVSIDALTDRYALRHTPLPSLPTVPVGVDGEGFDAIILPPDLASAFSAAASIPLTDASSQLPHRKGERSRRIAREALASRPRTELDALAPLGAAGPSTTATLDNVGSIAIAPVSRASSSRVQVLFHGVVAIDRAEVRTPYPIVARIEVTHERHLRSTFDSLTTAGVQGVERIVEAGALALAARLAKAAHEGDVGDAARSFLAAWVGHKGRRGLHDDPALRESLSHAPLWRTPRGERVALASIEGAISCVRAEPGEWMPPAEGEPPDPPYLCVSDESWVRCVAMIASGAARDVTQTALTTQRARRLRARGGARVKLDGAPPVKALSGRVEALADTLGVGEIRLVDAAPGVDVTVFVEGRVAHRTSLRAPFGMMVAIECAAIDPLRVSESFLQLDALPKLLGAARTLLERAALDAPVTLPSWARRAVRWWLLSTPGLGAEARALTAFSDSAGEAMSLVDFDAQVRAHDAVAFTTEAPPEPCAPLDADRRVVVLSADEPRWLGERWKSLNYTSALADDYAARRWERATPRDVIDVTGAPPGALRVRIDDDGLEGEVALRPPASAGTRGEVRWFSSRRQLGESEIDAPWPCVIAVEAKGLAPNRKRNGPAEGDQLRHVCDALASSVRRALDRAFATPSNALASAYAHDPKSPSEARGGPRVAGALWLSLDAREGDLEVTAESWSGHLGRDRGEARLRTPVHGRLWIRRGHGRDTAERGDLVAKVVDWAWREMLEDLVARVRSDDALTLDDCVVDHLVRAAARSMLGSRKLRAWARAATLPGTGVTFERVAGSERAPLMIVPVGDARLGSGDAVPDVDTPWLWTLRDLGRLRSPAEVEPPPSPHDATTSAPPASKPHAATEERETKWELGASLRAMFDAAPAFSAVVAKVTASHEPVSARRPMVRYDANARILTVFRAHPTVRSLEEGPRDHAAHLLALASAGAIHRGRNDVTDAHEAGFMEALLQKLAEP